MDAHGDTGHATVTVNVANVEETEAVRLSHDRLRAGAVITATLSDPDGNVSGETWQWSRGDEPINGATANSHTVTTDDVGHVLSATILGPNNHRTGNEQ